MKHLILLLTICSLSIFSFSQTSDNPYDETSMYTEGLARVKYKGLFGFIDAKKKEVIPIKYKSATLFKRGFSKVTINGKEYGLIDKNGKTVIPFEYQELNWYDNSDVIEAKKNGNWGLLNEKGKQLINFEFSRIDTYFDDLVRVTKSTGTGAKVMGFYDLKGKLVIPVIYEDLGAFDNDIATARKDGRSGFINRKNNPVIPFMYEEAGAFNEGLANVKLNGKWGYIDIKNNWQIKNIFDDAGIFYSGEAEVKLGSTRYFIDKTGKQLAAGRWLLLFTKGLKLGDQFWYRGNNLKDEALKKRWTGDMRVYDVSQNVDKAEFFLMLTNFYTRYQSPLFHSYSTDQVWEKIKELYKDGYSITSMAYGKNKWSFIATHTGNNAESMSKGSGFPYQNVEDAKEEGKFITTMAHGDGTWFVATRKTGYTDQIVETFYSGWRPALVEEYAKKDYYITNVVEEGGTYYVVFTKGSGIKEQVLLWSDEIPMREINQYWEKGYKSYKSFYLPRTTSDKTGDDDFWWF